MCLRCLARSLEILFCNIGGDHWAQNYWSCKKASIASFSSVFFLCLTMEGKKKSGSYSGRSIRQGRNRYHWNLYVYFQSNPYYILSPVSKWQKENKIHFGIAKFLEFECSNNLVLIKWKSQYVALHHCVR